MQEVEPPHESLPVLHHVSECSPSMLLYWASCASSLADMVEALALGADVNWPNPEDQSRTPLMQAVKGVSTNPPAAKRTFFIYKYHFSCLTLNRVCF